MIRRIILTILAACLLWAQKKPVTLEALQEFRARSRPATPGPVAWAPDSKSFAYRQGNALRLYEVAKRNSREIVNLQDVDAAATTPAEAEVFSWENRRVEEQSLQWLPSGKRLLYLSKGDVFLIDLDGKWRQLLKTQVAERDPKISPNGEKILFRRDWDVYTLEIATGKETRLTNNGTELVRNGALDWVYPEELGLGTAFWWSPDGRSILYLQFDISKIPQYPHSDLRRLKAVAEPQRYPQAGDPNSIVHVGVIPVLGGETTWLDVGDTAQSYLIPRVGWVPDSKHVYVVRTNRIQNQLEFLSIDTTTGLKTVSYIENNKYWINVEGDPVFLANGKEFLWTSEREGGSQIYRYSLDGREPVALTESPIFNTAISCVDDTYVYVVSDTGNLQRKLGRTRIDGATEEKDRFGTREGGRHRISMAPDCRHFLDTYSSLISPPETTLNETRNNKELAVFSPADKRSSDEFDLRPAELHRVEVEGITTLWGRLIKPPNFDPSKKYPVMVNVYGGPHVQSVRNEWSGMTMAQVFAHKGYLVWDLDNRGTTGRGHSFEAHVFRKLGVTELADQKAGIEYLKSLGFVDPNRIGVNGWSYGGFMTLNMMLNAPEVFTAGFAGAPVTSWLNYDSVYTERYMGLPKENAEGYARTALPPKAGNLKGKLMIAHNIEDDNVLFQNTLQMIQALELAGKRFELAIYSQKTHGVTGAAARQMEATMLDFFDRALPQH